MPTLIIDINFNGRQIEIYKTSGTIQFYRYRVNEQLSNQYMNADEIIRWLGNQMEGK